MSRSTFPTDAERESVAAWLEARPVRDVPSDYLTVKQDKLYLKALDTEVCVAWIAPSDGALYGMVSDGLMTAAYSGQIVNAILAHLGVDERIRRERRDNPEAPGGREHVWFHGEQPMAPGAPVLLAGPLTIMALRANSPRPGRQRNPYRSGG